MSQTNQEALLEAWLRLSLKLRGNRFVEGLSFNETVICGILYRSCQMGVEAVTATDLMGVTKLLKSQLNGILKSLEEKGLILRTRSEKDKRVVYIRLASNAPNEYLAEHERVMDEVVSPIYEALGEEKANGLTALLLEAIQVMEEREEKDER